MSIGYSNIAKSYLLEAIDSNDTQLIIQSGGYGGFMRINADYTYARIVNASQNELVKIDLSNSSPHTKLVAGAVTSYSGGLTVARGQGGTQAVSWPRGSLIYIEVTADFLTEIVQKGIFRTVDYNPNGVLSPAYKGEKVYQSDDPRWWKSYDGTNPYWAMICGVAAAGETWSDPGDLGWQVLMPAPELTYTAYFDDTKWVAPGWGTWVDPIWISALAGRDPYYYDIVLARIGSWYVNFRPTKMRITHDHTSDLLVKLYTSTFIYTSVTYSYSSGDEVDLTFAGEDLTYLSLRSTTNDFQYSVTNIEFGE